MNKSNAVKIALIVWAKRMGAATSEVKASHVAFISRPKTVAQLIEEAAAAARK
jgi:hypothetical protein